MTTPLDDAVAIVGMAAVFPGAPDLDRFWRNVVEGVDAVGPVPADRVDPVFFADGDQLDVDRFYCRRGGFIDAAQPFDPTEFGIMPIAVAEAEPDQMLALATATRALSDAGFGTGLDPTRTGIILGRGGYITPAIGRLHQRVRTAHQLAECVRELLPDLPDAQIAGLRGQFQAAFGPPHPEASIGLVPNLVASRVANRLDLRGPAYTVDAACASSLIAVSHAVQELTAGRCDVMLAGGVHHCHDVTLWSVFTQLRALSPSGEIRPFDRRADGILIGEGTGIVVLKRRSDAERDGDRIYALIRGVGVASDGRATTLMSPTVDGQVLAVERAWEAAGADPATVGLIEAHGTGTPAGDAAEIATLRRVFDPDGADPGKRQPVGIGSVKSMIGHAMPASGIAGLIKTALAVFHQVLPPSLHCQEPHPDLAGTRFDVVQSAQPWDRNGSPRRAGVNAFGFGGINAHVVLQESFCDLDAAPRRGIQVTERKGWAPPPMFVWAGERVDDLVSVLEDEKRVLAGALPAGPEGPVRLAIVEPTPKRVALARKVVARGQAWRGRNDLWFSPEGLITQGGKVAFTFPGVEPTLAPELEDVSAHFGIVETEAPVATEIGRHGMGIIRVGRLLVEAMSRLGIEPDVIAGHSLGEWTAMIESESVPPEVVDLFVGGLVAGQLVLPDLVFLAVGCSAELAREVVADLPDIVVSHDNCPHQAIVCGIEGSVAVAQERFKVQRVMGQVLPFRTGFHTPMFQDYMAPFVQCLGGLPLAAPRVPLWSSITATPFPSDEDQIRALALRLYVEPVRFRELVQNLYADGVRLFIQPGQGSVVGFIGDTLREHDHLAIAGAVPNRSGMEQLTRVVAALYVEGAEVRFDQLLAMSRADVPAVCSPPAAGRSGDALRFDAALIRGSLQPLDLGSRPSSPLPEGEFGATLRLIEEAARVVMEAAEHSSTPTPAPTAPTELRWRRRFTVEDEPALADHAFFRQPPGRSTLADRFPVVPMTMMVEVMAGAAQHLAPDRLVIGLQQIRALRWLPVDPPTDVDITAAFVGTDHDRVRVSIDGYARATVLLGDRYPNPPETLDLEPLQDEGPAPQNADQLYDERWMFHGPRYQGVSEIRTMGRDGVRGRVTALPAPGALLDAAGQYVGYWIMVNASEDRIALPMRIDRIDFYAPPPEIGTQLEVTVRFTEVTVEDIRADIELVQDGVLWGRMASFTDRRFDTTEPLFRVILFPEVNGLAEPAADGSWIIGEHWRSSASRELVMRRYLSGPERAEYAQLDPLAQRDWLRSRVALKDAVRAWLWDRGAGPLYPIEIEVGVDDQGQPVVHGPDGVAPRVRLTLRAEDAVVVVDEPTPTSTSVRSLSHSDTGR